MIHIDTEKCAGCGKCVPYCPTAALSIDPATAKAKSDPDRCTDCWVCIRNRLCPLEAIAPQQGPLTARDEFRHYMSDPSQACPTGLKGRGTEEFKTNDVTGKVTRNTVGFTLDVGRPGIGTTLDDVGLIVKAVVNAGLHLEKPELSPLGVAIQDFTTGELREEYKGTFVLSLIVEGTCQLEQARKVLQALLEVSKQINTVFSLGVCVRHVDNGAYPRLLEIIQDLDVPMLPYRGKVNVGLGRPFSAE